MRNILFIIIALLVSACHHVPPKHITSKNWGKATNQIIAEYAPLERPRLQVLFADKGIHYPPHKISLLAFKQENKMELWAQGRRNPRWQHIKDYDLTARSGIPGPKLKRNDEQIPEGIYRVKFLDPFSTLHLSMMLNYPNIFDRYHGSLDHRQNLGDNIFIHGKDASVGCLAIGDKPVTELFVLVHDIGVKQVQVVIAPNDLRTGPAVTDLASQPEWVPQLYYRIRQSLKKYS